VADSAALVAALDPETSAAAPDSVSAKPAAPAAPAANGHAAAAAAAKPATEAGRTVSIPSAAPYPYELPASSSFVGSIGPSALRAVAGQNEYESHVRRHDLKC